VPSPDALMRGHHGHNSQHHTSSSTVRIADDRHSRALGPTTESPTMTISTSTSSIDPVVVVTTATEDHHHHLAVTVEEGTFNDEEASTTATTTTTTSILHHLPSWVQDQRDSWGERLVVDEWQDDDGIYRNKHGWKVRR
jgi:hypothetical protein